MTDDVARTLQLATEHDPHPPHGGIQWAHVARDSFAARVEGLAHQAPPDEPPEVQARLVG